MKRFVFIATALLFLNFSSIAQSGCTNPNACNYDSLALIDDGSCTIVPIHKTWDNTYGSVALDSPKEIIRTNDGGLFIVGSTGSPSDYWCLKLDSDENIEWSYSFGGSGDDIGQSAVQCDDGGYLIGGYSNSPVGGFKTSSHHGLQDAWIIKLDASGSVEWQNSFGGNVEDILTKIEKSSDGGYYLGCYSRSSISGNKTSSNPSIITLGYWLIKIDNSGNKLWEKTLDGNNEDRLTFVLETSDYGILLGGYSASSPQYHRTAAHYGDEDIWIVKLDSSGVQLWQKSYGGSADDYAMDALESANGDLILSGASNSPISGNKSVASSNLDFWLLRTSSTGNIIWQKSYGGTAIETAYSASEDSRGNILYSGYSTSGVSGNKITGNQGSNDVWLVQTDANGNKLWEGNYGGSGTDISYSHVSDGSYAYISAYSNSDISTDKSDSAIGLYDLWLINLELYGNPGCTDSSACNYDSEASCDNGLCEYASCGQNISKSKSSPLILISSIRACDDIAGDINNSASASGDASCNSGQDLWYHFKAKSSALSLSLNSTWDGAMELQDMNGNLLSCTDDINGGGIEVLNIDGLTKDDSYFLVVSAVSPTIDGSFSLCVQYHASSYCTFDSNQSHQLCNIIKAKWQGEGTYIFNFYNQSNGDSISAPGTYYDKLVLHSVDGLFYNTSYDLRVDLIKPVSDGLGGMENLSVEGLTCELVIGPPPTTNMADRYSCGVFSRSHYLNDYIRTASWVCGMSTWHWEFKDQAGGLPIVINSGTEMQFIQLNQVPGLEHGHSYDVRVRATFANGSTSNWGDTKCIDIMGPINASELENNNEAEKQKDEESFIDSSVEFNIYPNPNKGEYLYVEIPKAEGKIVFTIHDNFGRIVLEKEIQEGNASYSIVDLNKFNSGLYIVRLQTEFNNQSRKLVVER